MIKPNEQKKDDTAIDELNKAITDDDLTDDDFFEKLLNEDVEAKDDSSNNKTDDDLKTEQSSSKNNEPTREELMTQIATLEKEAKGRLTDTVKSRQERSQFKQELTTLKSAVSELLDKRDGKDGKNETPKPLEEAKRKVEFEEDESAFVDLSPVKEALKESEEKTQKQLDEIKEVNRQKELKDQYTQEINTILDDDRETYDPAYKQLQVVIKALNDRVIEMQNRTNNLGDEHGALDIDTGLDLMDGTPEEKAFKEDFPGLNLTNIARAFNSKRDFKAALNDVAATLTTNGTETDTSKIDMKLVDEAKKKPGSLANQENRSSAGDSLLDKIGNLRTDQIMEISDAEAERLEKLMYDEEVRGE